MRPFSKSSMYYIVQIIDLASKVESKIKRGQIEDARRLLKLILKFDIKEFNKIEEETAMFGL